MSSPVPVRPATLPHRWWLAALSTPEAVAPAATHGMPEWAAVVERALAAAPEVGRACTVPPGAPAEECLAAPLTPFLDVAAALLDERLGVPVPAVDMAAVHRRLRDRLTAALTGTAARTLVAQLHADRVAGLLRGATARDRFADFVVGAGGRVRLAGLLARHPVLARLLGQACAGTATATAELLERLAADRAALAAGLLGGEPGELVDLALGAGDAHDGGRAVALLTFASGARCVYKPRPVGLQARFGELLAALGEQDPELALRGTGVLERDGYGWTGFVAHAPCDDAGGVARFYRRQGALLALLYALDATDVHYENLVACGDQPVVVDVETLLHPGFTPDTDAGDDPALEALHASAARTALLPATMLGEHGALDVSAFGAGAGGEFPDEVAAWHDAGTDGMRLAPARAVVPAAGNRPLLDGREVDPADHGDDLLAGFRAGYDALVTRAADLAAPGGPLARLAGERIRLVVRHTAAYAQLLTEATAPESLVDGAARERAFAPLFAPTGQAHLAALAPYESAALFTGDIPLFTARADSRDVHAGGTDGAVVPTLLHRCGLDAVRAKLARLGAVDRRDQEWVVRAALATRRAPVRHTAVGADPTPVDGALPDAQLVLALARGIGDELVARSWQDAERANWLGLEAVDGRFWSLLPMGAGLGEGYCGTALFLAQLGEVSGIGRYSELARRAVQGLPRLLGVLVRHPELAREVGPGGFAGFGGIAYALARLATLLDDRALAACLPDAVAATLLADLPGRPAVEDGTAGAVAALLAVHAETGLVAAADAAAELAGRLRPAAGGPGFARGATGVRWAAGRYAAATGRRAAAAEVRDPAQGLDWCGGATGDVLAALDTGALDLDAPVVDAYVSAVTGRPVSMDHSLCHGDLGAVDALVELAAAGHAGAAAGLPRAGARLLGAVAQRGPRCGTPRGVPSPGLLTGTAGIGYGLLRLAFADLVPSVLLLRPGPVRHT